jgi:hypothetical protein
VPWCFFVFVSSSSPAGGSAVRELPGGPVADWRLGLEMGRVGAQRRKPEWGSGDAVRSMTRSLRRRYSSARLPGGQGSAEPLEIGAKAMEAVQSLERSREELLGPARHQKLIDTARKGGKNAFAILCDPMSGRPWLPPAQAFSP